MSSVLSANCGCLYVVPTPLGCYKDITLHALEVLRQVDLIATEDTRVTDKLLTHYQIKKPLLSYYEQNELTRSDELLAKLQTGLNIALVSDAGTPLIQDPGFRLVAKAIELGIVVKSLPGPCALVTALVGSGLPNHYFSFCGFLPRQDQALISFIEQLKESLSTTIVYESPHRLLNTLKHLSLLMPERLIVVARELTKPYEEYLRGTAKQVYDVLATRDAILGEITLLIAGVQESVLNVQKQARARALSCLLKEQGLSNKSIKDLIATHYPEVNKKELYQWLLEQVKEI